MLNPKVLVVCVLSCLLGGASAQGNLSSMLESQPVGGEDSEGERLLGAVIQGGEDAPRNRFGYICSLRRPRDSEHVCGGVLISPGWVLTAAHCVDARRDSFAVSDPDVWIHLYSRDDSEEQAEKFGAEKVIVHCNWDGDVANGFDIALIKLNGESTQEPITMVPSSDFRRSSELLVALGWGRTSHTAAFADVLQMATDLQYKTDEDCLVIREEPPPLKTVCAASTTQDTCKGDSGGPLFAANFEETSIVGGDPSLDRLIGITSAGALLCGERQEERSDFIGIYTEIREYREWIDTVMETEKEPPCNAEDTPAQELGTETAGASETEPLLSQGPFTQEYVLPRTEHRRSARYWDALNDDDLILLEELLDAEVPLPVAGDSWTPLHSSVVEGKLDYMNLVLERYPEWVYVRPVLLEIAAERERGPVVDVLLNEHNADPNFGKRNGWTSLHMAVQRENKDIIVMLIEAGADPNLGSSVGWTPMHEAALRGSPELVALLIENGARSDPKDVDGLKPIYYTDSEDVIELLTQ